MNTSEVVEAPFRHKIGQDIFRQRLVREGVSNWRELANLVANDVCNWILPPDEVSEIAELIAQMKIIPGGRYLYYAGRPLKYFQNCYGLRSLEDTREDWARTYHNAGSCLMTGGGIGNNYSIYRGRNQPLKKTGGVASGPLPCMQAVNEIGRASVQGGGRRSAIYASLAHWHPDIFDFMTIKNWDDMKLPGTDLTLGEMKRRDFDFPCPLDHTNHSVQYGDKWIELERPEQDNVFIMNCLQAMRTGDPGFQFDFGTQSNHIVRNACTEFISDADSDACNLGSVNMSRIKASDDFARCVYMLSKFLYCGTMRSMTPYERVRLTRDKNRRIGLGLMGVHEWALSRNLPYEMTDSLRAWMRIYVTESERGANEVSDRQSLPRPKAYRAIAPTGTIGMMAGTTTGIEPIYSVAFRRRYRQGHNHRYQFVVDPTAKYLIERGVDPASIETAISLAFDVERRVKFQADMQDYVDMGISSTVNLPQWGSNVNNPDKVQDFANIVAKYAPRLRGITFYPDGARGGQPITPVDYAEAVKHEGKEYTEEAVDVCDLAGHGTCNN